MLVMYVCVQGMILTNENIFIRVKYPDTPNENFRCQEFELVAQSRSADFWCSYFTGDWIREYVICYF